MDSAQLVVLMLVVPLVAMLFVAWGVRGPSRWTMILWRFSTPQERIAREMGEMLLPVFPDMIDSIVATVNELAALDAAIADGGEGEQGVDGK